MDLHQRELVARVMKEVKNKASSDDSPSSRKTDSLRSTDDWFEAGKDLRRQGPFIGSNPNEKRRQSSPGLPSIPLDDHLLSTSSQDGVSSRPYQVFLHPLLDKLISLVPSAQLPHHHSRSSPSSPPAFPSSQGSCYYRWSRQAVSSTCSLLLLHRLECPLIVEPPTTRARAEPCLLSPRFSPRDRSSGSYRLIQYFSRFLAFFYLTRNVDQAKRFAALKSGLASGRKRTSSSLPRVPLRLISEKKLTVASIYAMDAVGLDGCSYEALQTPRASASRLSFLSRSLAVSPDS